MELTLYYHEGKSTQNFCHEQGQTVHSLEVKLLTNKEKREERQINGLKMKISREKVCIITQQQFLLKILITLDKQKMCS